VTGTLASWRSRAEHIAGQNIGHELNPESDPRESGRDRHEARSKGISIGEALPAGVRNRIGPTGLAP